MGQENNPKGLGEALRDNFQEHTDLAYFTKNVLAVALPFSQATIKHCLNGKVVEHQKKIRAIKQEMKRLFSRDFNPPSFSN